MKQRLILWALLVSVAVNVFQFGLQIVRDCERDFLRGYSNAADASLNAFRAR